MAKTGVVIVQELVKVYKNQFDSSGNPLKVKDENGNIITKENIEGTSDFLNPYKDSILCTDVPIEECSLAIQSINLVNNDTTFTLNFTLFGLNLNDSYFVNVENGTNDFEQTNVYNNNESITLPDYVNGILRISIIHNNCVSTVYYNIEDIEITETETINNCSVSNVSFINTNITCNQNNQSIINVGVDDVTTLYEFQHPISGVWQDATINNNRITYTIISNGQQFLIRARKKNCLLDALVLPVTTCVPNFVITESETTESISITETIVTSTCSATISVSNINCTDVLNNILTVNTTNLSTGIFRIQILQNGIIYDNFVLIIDNVTTIRLSKFYSGELTIKLMYNTCEETSVFTVNCENITITETTDTSTTTTTTQQPACIPVTFTNTTNAAVTINYLCSGFYSTQLPAYSCVTVNVQYGEWQIPPTGVLHGFNSDNCSTTVTYTGTGTTITTTTTSTTNTTTTQCYSNVWSNYSSTFCTNNNLYQRQQNLCNEFRDILVESNAAACNNTCVPNGTITNGLLFCDGNTLTQKYNTYNSCGDFVATVTVADVWTNFELAYCDGVNRVQKQKNQCNKEQTIVVAYNGCCNIESTSPVYYCNQDGLTFHVGFALIGGNGIYQISLDNGVTWITTGITNFLYGANFTYGTHKLLFRDTLYLSCIHEKFITKDCIIETITNTQTICVETTWTPTGEQVCVNNFLRYEERSNCNNLRWIETFNCCVGNSGSGNFVSILYVTACDGTDTTHYLKRQYTPPDSNHIFIIPNDSGSILKVNETTNGSKCVIVQVSVCASIYARESLIDRTITALAGDNLFSFLSRITYSTCASCKSSIGGTGNGTVVTCSNYCIFSGNSTIKNIAFKYCGNNTVINQSIYPYETIQLVNVQIGSVVVDNINLYIIVQGTCVTTREGANCGGGSNEIFINGNYTVGQIVRTTASPTKSCLIVGATKLVTPPFIPQGIEDTFDTCQDCTATL